MKPKLFLLDIKNVQVKIYELQKCQFHRHYISKGSFYCTVLSFQAVGHSNLWTSHCWITTNKLPANSTFGSGHFPTEEKINKCAFYLAHEKTSLAWKEFCTNDPVACLLFLDRMRSPCLRKLLSLQMGRGRWNAYKLEATLQHGTFCQCGALKVCHIECSRSGHISCVHVHTGVLVLGLFSHKQNGYMHLHYGKVHSSV